MNHFVEIESMIGLWCAQPEFCPVQEAKTPKATARRRTILMVSVVAFGLGLGLLIINNVVGVHPQEVTESIAEWPVSEISMSSFEWLSPPITKLIMRA